MGINIIMPKKIKTDAELVALSIRDPGEYGRLIERYEKRLGRYIHRIMGFNRECKEDVLQEVFLKIYLNLNDFDKSFSFSSWAYRIAHNEAVNYLKKNKKVKVIPLENDDENVKSLIEIIENDTDLNKELVRKENIETIRKVISMLSPDYKNVLILRYIEDLDYREIGDVLKIPIGTVGTMVHRAKKQFKDIYLSLNI